MNDPIQIIKANREEILIGEIGALLHDIGKCHPDFIRRQSIEKVGKFDHWKIDQFLDPYLIKLMKNSKFGMNINNEKTDVYSIITEHHNKKTNKNLIRLIESCDRLDSADDKGIVRKKQPMNDTIINSPFEYPRERIDLDSFKHWLDSLSSELTDLFDKYVSNSIDITTLRKEVIENLKFAFLHALGETRIPSNDVTLWDHSHSTASLFKSMLCKVALKETPGEQWRIFGFCWNGTGFIGKGKKIADILERNKIIENTKKELQEKFEDRIPIGNTIYEDKDGIYFTFPDLEGDKLKKAACECAREGLKIIRCNSSDEIFPFFIVSEPSRTLTILVDVLKFASAKREVPKMSPTIYVGSSPEEEKIEDNPEVELINGNRDICPICQFRSKSMKSETCDICRNRRKERRDKWFLEREQTIWMDEVADQNGRVALLTLSFDLDKWLDGTMVQTIFSQSFENWYSSKGQSIHCNRDYMNKISRSLGIEINEKTSKRNLAHYFLKFFILEESRDPNFGNNLDNIQLRTRVFNTFFEEFAAKHEEKDNKGQNNPNYIKKIWGDLKSRTKNEDLGNILSILFAQNPSPARLYRIWKETEEFFELAIREVREKTYYHKWKRLRFKIDVSKIILKNNLSIEEMTSYIIKTENLEPENLLIFHSSNGEFFTIESLNKFKLKNRPKLRDINGIKAVQEALRINPIYHFAEEDTPDENLLEHEQRIDIIGNEEEYYPFIEITKAPISLQMIIPASDSIRILELITRLYSERFAKVIGKLPLNAGLLVSKRKFPLYVLLNAGERILRNKIFREPIIMDPYWDISEVKLDEYYRFYPTKKSTGDRHYTLDDIEPLSKGKLFALYPGYFDFELLTDTASRYTIVYNEGKRADDNYKMLSARPIYFYQISHLLDLWEILSNNLSSSQKMFFEEMISSKVVEWGKVSDPQKKKVFREFVEAVLRDAFADRWNNLRKETQDFLVYSAVDKRLLDTLMLFRHIVKAQEADEDGNEIC